MTQDNHKEIVKRIAEAARALASYVVRGSAQQPLVYHAARRLSAGAFSGTAIGRFRGRSNAGGDDARAAGMLLGAVLGALIDGVVGSSIAKDGPVLGIWQKDAKGIRRWTRAEFLVPVRRLLA